MSDAAEASSDESALSVGQALRLPPLDQGRIRAGRDGLGRSVRWVAVIERPVENFVAPGELILTTGVGCDVSRLERMVLEVAESGAAGLCISPSPDGAFKGVPDSAVALGETLDFPIIELPWAVRFADILRAVIDRLLSARYAAVDTGNVSMPSGLTSALLRGDGLAAVAQAAEELLDRPVLVLDSAFAPLTAGALASERPEDLARLAERAAGLSADDVRALSLGFEAEDVVSVDVLAPLGLASALVAPAVAQNRVLGFVIALGDGRQSNALSVERHALRHAGVAAALELLRQRAAAEAEARVHGDFVWEIATGAVSRQELAAKATLLGYSLRQRFGVMLARVEDGAADEVLAMVVHQLRRRGVTEHLHASARANHVLVLVPSTAPPLLQPASLATSVAGQLCAGAVSWGIADGSVELGQLPEGVRRARRALEVGRSLHGPGVLADAVNLQPYLMLGAIASDPEAQQAAHALLEPLLRYDKAGARELIHSLEVYLHENANATSAARRLHLNRHSLLYRLRKIESLTGRDLGNHDDRFVFEVSLRIQRLRASVDAPL